MSIVTLLYNNFNYDKTSLHLSCHNISSLPAVICKLIKLQTLSLII
jgi:Leucine-rich repeat (LRR) protein